MIQANLSKVIPTLLNCAQYSVIAFVVNKNFHFLPFTSFFSFPFLFGRFPRNKTQIEANTGFPKVWSVPIETPCHHDGFSCISEL